MLIGLHGRAGSGKDESYGYIAEWAVERQLQVRRDAFADRLKWSAAQALGYQGTREKCIAICNRLKQPGCEITVSGPEGISTTLTGRAYLQLYGTEAHRQVFGTNFWIDAVTNTYQPDELLVVTDIRFPNEAEAIRDLGGEVWKVLRPGRQVTAAESSHLSEQSLEPDLIDQFLRNDRGLVQLRGRVRQCAARAHAKELR